jgi:hypothetical protein
MLLVRRLMSEAANVIFKKAKERVYRVIPLSGSGPGNAAGAAVKPSKTVINGMWHNTIQCAGRTDDLTVCCVLVIE